MHRKIPTSAMSALGQIQLSRPPPRRRSGASGYPRIHDEAGAAVQISGLCHWTASSRRRPKTVTRAGSCTRGKCCTPVARPQRTNVGNKAFDGCARPAAHRGRTIRCGALAFAARGYRRCGRLFFLAGRRNRDTAVQPLSGLRPLCTSAPADLPGVQIARGARRTGVGQGDRADLYRKSAGMGGGT